MTSTKSLWYARKTYSIVCPPQNKQKKERENSIFGKAQPDGVKSKAFYFKRSSRHFVLVLCFSFLFCYFNRSENPFIIKVREHHRPQTTLFLVCRSQNPSRYKGVIFIYFHFFFFKPTTSKENSSSIRKAYGFFVEVCFLYFLLPNVHNLPTIRFHLWIWKIF